jgi:hypothetical protein
VFFQLFSPGHDEIAPFGANPPPIAANIAQKFLILQKISGLPRVWAVFSPSRGAFNESSRLQRFLAPKSSVPVDASGECRKSRAKPSNYDGFREIYSCRLRQLSEHIRAAFKAYRSPCKTG